MGRIFSFLYSSRGRTDRFTYWVSMSLFAIVSIIFLFGYSGDFLRSMPPFVSFPLFVLILITMVRFSYAIKVRRVRDAGYGGASARRWYYVPFGNFFSTWATLHPSKSKYADVIETRPELIEALKKGIQEKIPKVKLWQQTMNAGYSDKEFSHHYFLASAEARVVKRKQLLLWALIIFVVIHILLVIRVLLNAGI